MQPSATDFASILMDREREGRVPMSAASTADNSDLGTVWIGPGSLEHWVYTGTKGGLASGRTTHHAKPQRRSWGPLEPSPPDPSVYTTAEARHSKLDMYPTSSATYVSSGDSALMRSSVSNPLIQKISLSVSPIAYLDKCIA